MSLEELVVVAFCQMSSINNKSNRILKKVLDCSLLLLVDRHSTKMDFTFLPSVYGWIETSQ